MKKSHLRKTFFIYGLGILVFFLVVTLVLLSPMFAVASVTIEGNYRVSDESILRYLGLVAPSDVNIFLYYDRSAVRRLTNPYIESIHIRKDHFSREIAVTINERRLAGFVEFAPGQYLFIDENGLVLETATSFSDRLPVVVGLDFVRFTIGAPLEVSNEQAFQNMVAISRILNRHEMTSDVVRVDVNDSSNIRLFIGDLDISFGDTTDGDQKMQTLIQILENIKGENIRGTLDISDTTRNSVLRHLT